MPELVFVMTVPFAGLLLAGMAYIKTYWTETF